MSKLQLSIAIGDYDRNRPLIDGRVKIDGVDPVVMTLTPEEMFFRAMRHEAFDVCELSLSSFTLRTARGDCPYVGVPAFLSREMLMDGDIDAYIGPRAPSSFIPSNPTLSWIFPDPTVEAIRFYEKTKIFPIMHLVGVRKSLAEQHPWLPMALLKAFTESKRIALEHLSDTAATKITLPFVEEQLRRAHSFMGDDFWSYGADANRHVLEAFTRHHHAQGISPRVVGVEELFHPGTLESFKI